MPTHPPQPVAPLYPSDVTEEEWLVLEPLLPPPKPGGRPRSVALRAVINGIFYMLRSGCVRRVLPHDLPPWPTACYYFWSWRRDGTWERIQDELRAAIRRPAARSVPARRSSTARA